jgi:outer membrane protein, multidrug efflux system
MGYAVCTYSSKLLMFARSLAALLTACAIAGCAVGPIYKGPEVQLASQFRSQVGPSEATSIADLPWWNVFNDKTLQSLIVDALTNNYDLRVAVTRIEQARALVGVAQADFYPQIGYQGVAGRDKAFVPLESSSGNVTFNTFGNLLSAAWELDVWGRIRHTTEAARASLYSQEYVRRGVMLTLVSSVAESYFSLIEFDRELMIARESSETYRQTLDLFTSRFRAGRDSKLGVVRAQAAYDSSSASIANLTRAIGQQENALSVLLGGFPKAIDRGIALTAQVAPPTPTGLTTELLKRRPDILQAEQGMIGANAELGIAVANFYPRIGLGALFGGQSPKIDDMFKSEFNIWSIGGSITGPIFQGGRLKSAYRAQEAYWDQTIAQYKQTIIVAFRETSDALIARQTLVDQCAAIQSQVVALREAAGIATERYGAGRASYFEVLEAEQQLFPAESALAQTQRDQLVAVVNLYKALGGGWNLKDDEWAQPH